jgi:hypothetical protein
MSSKDDFYKIFVILATISLIIIIFYGLSLTSPLKGFATTTYRSGSYSLQYPSGWQVKKLDNYPAQYGPVLVIRDLNEAVVFTSGSTGFESFGIRADEVTSEVPTNLESMKTYFTSILDTVELKEGKCGNSPPDYRSCNFTYDFSYKGVKLTQGRLFLLKGNKLYDIAYASRAEKFEDNRVTFDSIINSLKLF